MSAARVEARDFLQFDEAKSMDDTLTPLGFRLRLDAYAYTNKHARMLTVRLVWRSRSNDSAVLTLRLPTGR